MALNKTIPSTAIPVVTDKGLINPVWWKFFYDFLTLVVNAVDYPDLGALEQLTGTGFAARIADNTWALRTFSAGSIKITVTNGDGVSGNCIIDVTESALTLNNLSGTLSVSKGGTSATTTSGARTALGLSIGTDVQAFDSTLTALAAYSTNGLVTQTGVDNFTGRTIVAPVAGITVSNGDGVSGNPTLALANDLAALEGLSGTGFVAHTASETYIERTIVGTSGEINVSNGNGAAGNPTLSVPNDCSFEATRGSAQSISTATFTKVQFNTETFDSDSTYDNATNYRHSPTTAGKYFYTASVQFEQFTSANAIQAIALYKNGTIAKLRRVESNPLGSFPATLQVSGVFDMNGSSDYIEVYVIQLNAGSINILADATYNNFSGYRLGV